MKDPARSWPLVVVIAGELADGGLADALHDAAFNLAFEDNVWLSMTPQSLSAV